MQAGVRGKTALPVQLKECKIRVNKMAEVSTILFEVMRSNENHVRMSLKSVFYPF